MNSLHNVPYGKYPCQWRYMCLYSHSCMYACSRWDLLLCIVVYIYSRGLVGGRPGACSCGGSLGGSSLPGRRGLGWYVCIVQVVSIIFLFFYSPRWLLLVQGPGDRGPTPSPSPPGGAEKKMLGNLLLVSIAAHVRNPSFICTSNLQRYRKLRWRLCRGVFFYVLVGIFRAVVF